MTWLLSLLGLGGVAGIVAALVFIPGAATKAADLALAGIKVVTTYPREIAIAALVLVVVWCWHGWSGADARVGKERAARLAERSVWAEADRVNHATIETLIATLNEQTASIETWYKAAQRAQAENAKALAAERVRGAKLRDKASALEQLAPSLKSDCKTPGAVLDLKGDI